MPLDNFGPRVTHIPGWSLIVLFLAYALPGNIGHEPWRGDDVLHIAIAAEMLWEGDWLIPRVADALYLDWPPLTYWLGAIFGFLFDWLLPLHDAIRLVSVAALALSVWSLRQATRRLFGPDAANAAFLISLGSLGLLIHAHEMQPQIVLLAAICSSLYGLTLIPERPQRGGLIAGVAGAAAFLAGGLSGTILTLPLWVVLPMTLSEYRRGELARGYATAFGLSLGLVILWPIALAVTTPGAFSLWWSYEVQSILPNAGHLGRSEELAELLAWFAWPLWPIALWTIWRRRTELRRFTYALPIAALVPALWLVITTGPMRPASIVPLLPPLIVLAASEIPRLRRGAANAFDWFGVMTFSLTGLFVWVSWSAMHFGWPAPLARNIVRLAPTFDPHWVWWELALAISVSVGWIVAIVRMPFFPLRGAVHWALGVTLVWALAASLWQPWFDYDKNYRPIMTSVGHLVRQQGSDCVAGLELGVVQRAAFYYFEQIKVDNSISAERRCRLLLTYASGREPADAAISPEWRELLRQERGRGRNFERFVLYSR